MPISISFNVSKLEKDKFFKGKKGIYCDLVLWETPDSDYGDYLVKQRGEKGEKMPILGNAKTFKLKAEKGKRLRDEDEDDNDEQIPF
jgi:hypothetical protein